MLLELPAPVTFDMVQTREDMLIGGQRIARYKIEAFVDGAWKAFAPTKTCAPSRHPSPACRMNKGVHGQTVGIRIVDFVPTTTASKLRWTVRAPRGVKRP